MSTRQSNLTDMSVKEASLIPRIPERKLTELSVVSVGGFMHGRMLPRVSSDDLTTETQFSAFLFFFLIVKTSNGEITEPVHFDTFC